MNRLHYQNNKRKLLMFFVMMMLTAIIFAQRGTSVDRKSLEARQKRLKEQIAINQKLLDEARKNKAASLGEITLLNSQIRKRRELLNTIESEIRYMNRQLKHNEMLIKQLEVEINRLKAAYAKTIYLSYKLRSTDDRLLYLLASRNLNQAWIRARFLQRMAAGRRDMYNQLNETREQMEGTSRVIRAHLDEKQLLRAEKNRESLNLTAEKEKKNQVLGRIQKEESRIVADIRKKQKEAADLETRISKIIREEMQKSANRKTETTAKARETSVAEVKLSNTFSANKGKLPWPVEQGTISNTFGTKKHPDFDVYTENNGIDFITSQGTSAKAVFEGEVSEVIQLPSYYAVLVKHGDFFTLYSKLQTVCVKKGEKIPTGHLIGLIKTGEHGTEFHFELWQGRTKQNPQSWLRR